MSSSAAHRAVETIWRSEAPRLVAVLTRLVRDVGAAEEIAQDALVAALEEWPRSGVPENPGAWLMHVARNRAFDLLRRRRRRQRSAPALARQAAEEHEADRLRRERELDAAIDSRIEDDLLRLVFAACHPALSVEARVALTLRLLGGLTTEEIARAFLTPVPTMAQRIVRAKRTLAERRAAFDVPSAELAARLPSVLEAVYLIFNEGYMATEGDDLIRPALCDEALRLGRLLAELMPLAPEVHGLLALMEIQASRATARVDASGAPVLLLEQDRGLWDQEAIRRGLAALRRAEQLAGPRERGPYLLQAAIAACHARASDPGQTDWRRISELYEELSQVAPSPVVTLNRAVAVSMAAGPEAALAIVESIADAPALADYHLLPSVRGDLLFRLGRKEEARLAFERAARLTRNAREREFLLGRARACAVDPAS